MMRYGKLKRANKGLMKVDVVRYGNAYCLRVGTFESITIVPLKQKWYRHVIPKVLWWFEGTFHTVTVA